MKKIILYLIIAIGISACADKLELYPRDSVTPETITSDDIPTLINGVYAAARDGGLSYWALGYLTEDLSSDNLIYRATFFQHGEVENNKILSNNVLVTRYYNAPYTIIQRANDVLEVLGKSTELSASEKSSLEAEVKTIRAYAYYRLVTLFGGVPIIETRDPAKQLIPRNTEEEVWNYIIEDLKVGLNAPSYDKRGSYYISQEAAKLLLARAYLIRGNNAEAKRLADELIASPLFALQNDYGSIWNVAGTNNETIFALEVTTNDGGSAFHGFFLRHSRMPGSGRAELPVDKSLYDLYEPGDKRRTVITYVNDPAYNPRFHYFCYKYQDPGDQTSKFYIARIAEAYLISAEASYKLNPSDASVLTNINTLRTKRGASALGSVDLHDIVNERRLELAFEGTRWTDMKRTPSKTNPSKSMAQEFVEAKGRGINDLLYPIPTAAMDVNPKLTQNPGY